MASFGPQHSGGLAADDDDEWEYEYSTTENEVCYDQYTGRPSRR
jgi:hypothetical protein